MATYRRESVVAAPLSAVWEFHATVDGLTAVTPDWLGLCVESVRGPDGDPDPDVLDVGSEMTVTMRPFGVVPGGSWIARIVERERTERLAWFRDVMTDGPLRAWEHRHEFHRVDEGTRIVDHVEYALPPGRIGRTCSPLGVIGLDPLFRYRHRRTRALLERGDATPAVES